MAKIKRFIECTVPVTACNLRCSYCYLIQQNRRNTLPIKFDYSPKHIGLALSRERFGGICLFSLTGAGETLIPRNVINIAQNILRQGHFVNITTNGLLSKRFDELIMFSSELLERLHFSFSLHYLELIRKNSLGIFFDNIQKVKKAGCSYVVQFNLCDEYVPHLDSIMKICLEKVGAPPQVAVTRREVGNDICLMTRSSRLDYVKLSKRFDSPLFNYGLENFNIKRNEFCYAGDWSFKLLLENGLLKSCYNSASSQNIFKDINKPIKFKAIGNNCRSPYCINSTHFMSLGIIPEIQSPSYATLRNRKDANWYSELMETALNGKLSEMNNEYSRLGKINSNATEKVKIFKEFIKNKLPLGFNRN